MGLLRDGAAGAIAQAVASVSNVLVAVVVARALGVAALRPFSKFSFLSMVMTLFSERGLSDEGTGRGISSTQWLRAFVAPFLTQVVALGFSSTLARRQRAFALAQAVGSGGAP
jgi:hypothetical protein